MIGLTLYQQRPRPPLPVPALGWGTAALTFGLLTWSVGRVGL